MVSWLSIITLFGAFNALLLGAVSLYSYAAASARGRYLGALLLIAGLVMMVITLEHQGWVPRIPLIYIAEEILSLLYGSLLLGFVLASLGRSMPRSALITPLVLYLTWMMLSFVFLPHRYRPPLGMEHIMWVQIAYFLVAVSCYLHLRQSQASRPGKRHELTLPYMLGALAVIHVAQIIRWLFSDTGILRDIVPLTSTVFFYLFLIFALRHSRSLRVLNAQVTHDDSGQLTELWNQLQTVMDDHEPWRETGLNPSTLAALLNCSVGDLRMAIQVHHGGGFYSYVALYRLREAQRLLRDPAEKRYSIEGLALQCGYASRSAFYKSFKEATGMTPAQFREQAG